MDKQRQHSYIYLIQKLLDAQDRNEVSLIIAKQKELIDIEFVQVMQQAAENFATDNDYESADFLIKICRELAEEIVRTSPTINFQKVPNPDSRLDFMIPVLQSILHTNGSAEDILPLLRKNLDRLDNCFISQLRRWFADIRHDLTDGEVQHLALLFVRFSELIKMISAEIQADEIEVSIACHDLASQTLDFQRFPGQWAAIHNNLAIAYRGRLRGERAKNLENALLHYNKALKVLTSNSFPEQWAMLQSNLANTYSERIYGDLTANLEHALVCNMNALQVFTKQNFPEDWATTQLNLAVVYKDRVDGNREQNLQRALLCCHNALKVYYRKSHPERWAKIQVIMATVNSYIGQEGDLEDSITGYRNALQVYQKDSFKKEWAETTCLLGMSYSHRIKEGRAINIEKAITCYESALSVLTRPAYPEDWARTQNNLGITYRNRIDGNREENLERSIEFLKNALIVYQFDRYPKFYTETTFNLGVSYKEHGDYSASYDSLVKSASGAEFLREEITSNDANKQKIAENYHQIYQALTEVSLELNNSVKAIEYAERSKTRNLVNLLLTRDRHTIFPAETVAQLDRLRNEIASSQHKIQSAVTGNTSVLAENLKKLRQRRNNLQDRYLSVAANFQLQAFQSTLNDRTAIIEFFITTDKLLIFIITKQIQRPISLSPQLVDLNKLVNWTNGYLRAFASKKDHWQRRLTTRLSLLAKILHIDEIIDRIPSECDKLIIIPHRYLHLLPFHGLPLGKSDTLFDRFPKGVSYSPSCQLLKLIQNRYRPDFSHLLAVQNPTGDLSYAELEVEVIQHYFNASHLFKQELATKENISNAPLESIHCAHFSCHGYFNGVEPQKSVLILANANLATAPTQLYNENHFVLKKNEILDLDKCLTLDTIFSLNLENCRLVTLSACETGLVDFRNISDEYVGLPSGFIYAGAASVVSSLWAVDDLSTSLLMVRFYQNLQDGLTLALALNRAQLWLRDLSKKELEIWITENQLLLKPAMRLNLRRLLRLKSGTQPFQSPFYWAAFFATSQ